MLVKLAPPSVDRCHCTVGVGTPDAAAMKLTEVPGVTVWSVGLVVIAGAWLTWMVRFCVAFGRHPVGRGQRHRVGAAGPGRGARDGRGAVAVVGERRPAGQAPVSLRCAMG